MKEFRFGRVYGLEVTTTPAIVPGFAGLGAVLAIVGASLLQLAPLQAILFGLLGAMANYASEMWHHIGHAWAARRTGHPMSGVRFGFLLGLMAQSVYPRDEGELPMGVHLRRALGGPLANSLVAMVALPLVARLQPTGGLAYALALWVFVENLFLYTVQAIIPLGFNDGATVWAWIRSKTE